MDRVERARPTTGVAVGEDEVGMLTVGATEAEHADGAPLLGEGGAAGGVPGALKVAAGDRWQGLRRHVDEVGDRAVRRGADADRRVVVWGLHAGGRWTLGGAGASGSACQSFCANVVRRDSGSARRRIVCSGSGICDRARAGAVPVALTTLERVAKKKTLSARLKVLSGRTGPDRRVAARDHV